MLKTNEFRKKMADVFIKSLEEKQFEWKKEWAAMEVTSFKSVHIVTVDL